MFFLTLVGLRFIPTNWKQAGGEGVYWSFTGVGDSTELLQVLSQDILSVHWARAGAGLAKGCEVSIIEQRSRFFENRENHAMYGALLTAATGACWPKARVAGLLHVDLEESCVRCGAVRDDSLHQIWSCPVINAIPHDHIRNSQHLFQRAMSDKGHQPLFLDQRHGPGRADGVCGVGPRSNQELSTILVTR